MGMKLFPYDIFFLYIACKSFMQNVIKITLIRRLFPEQTKPIQHLPFHKNVRSFLKTKLTLEEIKESPKKN